jgi:hypothetical protein
VLPGWHSENIVQLFQRPLFGLRNPEKYHDESGHVEPTGADGLSEKRATAFIATEGPSTYA